MSALIVANKNAGTFERFKTLLAPFDEGGCQRNLATLCLCDSEDRLPAVVADARLQGVDTFIAAGGDGTIHSLVNAMRKHLPDARLGIVPMGTGNDLSRSLGINADPAAALEFALSATSCERRIDLIEVRAEDKTRLCVNLAAGGLGGLLEKNVGERDLKERFGALGYLGGAALAVSQASPFKVTLSIDGATNPSEILALNIVIANGAVAGGGYAVAPGASPDDRLLDVIVIHEAGALDLAAIAAGLLAGDYTKNSQVSALRARKISVSSKPPMPFSVDGNLFGDTPLDFVLRPAALRVLCPQEEKPTAQKEVSHVAEQRNH